jgi:uncharacterized MAPEG superfamily protein
MRSFLHKRTEPPPAICQAESETGRTSRRERGTPRATSEPMPAAEATAPQEGGSGRDEGSAVATRRKGADWNAEPRSTQHTFDTSTRHTIANGRGRDAHTKPYRWSFGRTSRRERGTPRATSEPVPAAEATAPQEGGSGRDEGSAVATRRKGADWNAEPRSTQHTSDTSTRHAIANGRSRDAHTKPYRRSFGRTTGSEVRNERPAGQCPRPTTMTQRAAGATLWGTQWGPVDSGRQARGTPLDTAERPSPRLKAQTR